MTVTALTGVTGGSLSPLPACSASRSEPLPRWRARDRVSGAVAAQPGPAGPPGLRGSDASCFRVTVAAAESRHHDGETLASELPAASPPLGRRRR
jgi:hypothetical protein